jgi:hypothetical protein
VEPDGDHDRGGGVFVVVRVEACGGQVLRQQGQPPEEPAHSQRGDGQRHRLVGFRSAHRHRCGFSDILCGCASELQVVLPLQRYVGVRLPEDRPRVVLRGVLGHQD